MSDGPSGPGRATGARPLVRWPTSSTSLAGVVGFPVRQSLSPVLHNAAFGALGIDWAYVAFEVGPAAFEAAVAGAAALGLRGLSVTMPHKDAAAHLATRRSATARHLGAANTLSFVGRDVVAESTDGAGLVDDLRSGAGFDPDKRRCGVVGAGGAGRAAVLALAASGAREVVIVNRTVAAAWKAAALAPGVARVGRADELEAVELVVQATPVGMGETPGDDAASGSVAGVDPARLGAGQVVVDLVYEPARTLFLAEAAAHGATVRNGLGMLVHQAARQVELWTGAAAPLGAMWAAVS